MSDLEYLVRLISECQAKEKRRFASAAASIDFDNLYDKIEHIAKNNNNNKEIMMKAASYSPMILTYASEELKKDPEVILFALKTPNVAKYISSYGLDSNVLKIVQEELLKHAQENKKEFYALDGSQFETPEEALAYNETLLNVKSR